MGFRLDRLPDVRSVDQHLKGALSGLKYYWLQPSCCKKMDPLSIFCRNLKQGHPDNRHQILSPWTSLLRCARCSTLHISGCLLDLLLQYLLNRPNDFRGKLCVFWDQPPWDPAIRRLLVLNPRFKHGWTLGLSSWWVRVTVRSWLTLCSLWFSPHYAAVPGGPRRWRHPSKLWKLGPVILHHYQSSSNTSASRMCRERSTTDWKWTPPRSMDTSHATTGTTFGSLL